MNYYDFFYNIASILSPAFKKKEKVPKSYKYRLKLCSKHSHVIDQPLTKSRMKRLTGKSEREPLACCICGRGLNMQNIQQRSIKKKPIKL